MRFSIGLLFSLLASVAQSAVTFSVERAVSAPVYAPAVGEEHGFAAASDGTDFLVLWGGAPLYATRVSGSGDVRVPPLAIRTASYAQYVSTCWTSSAYLVTWTDADQQNVMVAAVSRDGNLITTPHVIASQARTFSGALAWNGRHAFLVYATRAPANARAALMDADGVVLRTDVVLPFSGADVDDTVKAATDGSNFGVIWRTSTARVILSPQPPATTPTDTYQIARVGDSGQLLGPAGALIATTGQTGGFGIAYGAGRYAVAALERGIGDAAVLRRFTIDAITLQSEALPPINTGGYDASVIWNGTDFVSYWMYYTFKSFQIITLAGNGLPTPVISGDVFGFAPILTSNGSKFLLTWTDRSRLSQNAGFGGDLFGAFLDRSAATTPSQRFDIGFGVRPQWQPVIATSGSTSFVVWIEQTNDSEFGELLGARLNADGTPIDTTPIDLGSHVSIWTRAAVAFTGSAYFVIWDAGENRSQLVGRRVAMNGEAGALLDFGSGTSPAVVSNGTVTLVAFARYPDILAVRVNERGEIVDSPPLHLSASRYAVNSFSVATNGVDFLVVWTDGSDFWQFPAPQLYDVVGVRVTAAGSGDATPIEISTGPKDQRYSEVVSDGRNYMVFYLLGPTGGNSQLAAKRVFANGTLADTTPSDDGVIVAENVWDFSVARDATGYAVAWQTLGAQSLLQFAQLDFSGKTIDLATATSTSSVYFRMSPSVASNRDVLQLAYARPADEYGGRSRVFIRSASLARSRAMRPVK
jgi:hypothetical protein